MTVYGIDAELRDELAMLRADGLYKSEGRLESPQSRTIVVGAR